MGDFDFGEEQLKFMFERWKVMENLKETEKLGKDHIASAEDFIMNAQWLEARLNKYMGNLEKWMEGSRSKLDGMDQTD
ncbi:hypothetical protein ACQCT5_15150 [Sutcliffiella halmapala]